MAKFEQIDIFSFMETIDKPQEETIVRHCFDEFLRRGGNTDGNNLKMIFALSRGVSDEDCARIMRENYVGGNGINGLSCVFEGEIVVSLMNSALDDDFADRMSYEDAVQRIKTMLNDGEFASIEDIDKAERFMKQQAAQEIWYMLRDLSFRHPFEERLHHSFPEDVQQLQVEFVERRDEVAQMLDEVCDAYEKDPAVMRFKFHKPTKVRDLFHYSIKPAVCTFPKVLNKLPDVHMFITEDEIRASVLCGSNVAGCESRTLKFFKEHQDKDERISFLRNEYGIGGRSHAVSGATHSSENHDSKGITLSKRCCDDVKLTWKQVEKYYDEFYKERNLYDEARSCTEMGA